MENKILLNFTLDYILPETYFRAAFSFATFCLLNQQSKSWSDVLVLSSFICKDIHLLLDICNRFINKLHFHLPSFQRSIIIVVFKSKNLCLLNHFSSRESFIQLLLYFENVMQFILHHVLILSCSFINT